MMKRRLHRQQDGFTILEMMIAAAVFSVILLVAAAGILSFTNAYYKGVTSTTTQQATRNILNDITRNIQLSSGGVQVSDDSICINGSLQYAYRLGGPIVGPGNDHAMVKDSNSSDCMNASVLSNATLSSSQEEMLGEHMRLAVFNVAPVAGGGTYSVHVRVIYGDYDLLTLNGTTLTSAQDTNAAWWKTNGANVQCRSTVGSQFCAVSDLKTTVQVRL